MKAYNTHLIACSEERRSFSNKTLNDLGHVSIETEQYQIKLDECLVYLKTLIGNVENQIEEKDALEKEVESYREKFEQSKTIYLSIDEMEKEYLKKHIDNIQIEIENKYSIKTAELENLISEKDIEIDYLKEELEMKRVESDLLTSNMEEIKSLASLRERNLINEIQALKLNNENLIDINDKRENIIQEEINIHREEVKFHNITK